MEGSIKIEFKDEDTFTIYYISENLFKTEEEFKNFFKLLNHELYTRYDYEFHGYYDVTIYHNSDIYVLDFNFVDDFGRCDFNITMLLNSTILYEFLDNDLVSSQKIYYKEKYYIEIYNIISDIRLFEYGRVVYGDEVDKILNSGILVT